MVVVLVVSSEITVSNWRWLLCSATIRKLSITLSFVEPVKGKIHLFFSRIVKTRYTLSATPRCYRVEVEISLRQSHVRHRYYCLVILSYNGPQFEYEYLFADHSERLTAKSVIGRKTSGKDPQRNQVFRAQINSSIEVRCRNFVKQGDKLGRAAHCYLDRINLKYSDNTRKWAIAAKCNL